MHTSNAIFGYFPYAWRMPQSSRQPPSLTWIASFVAVVEQGTFTAAATALNRAQPRVSAHVAALENHLGAALLVRGSRRVELTAAGSAYLPHATAALSDLHDGDDAVSAMSSTMQGRVRVGGYPGAMAVFIAPLIRRFRALYPGVEVRLREADPTALEDLVASGEVDLAVRTADVPQRHHNVPSEQLFYERIQMITRRDRRPMHGGVADPSIIEGTTVIVSGDPLGGWEDYRDRLDRIGVEPEEVITVVQPTTVMALVREGLGVGLLGALAARVTISDELTAMDLPEPLWLREIRVYRRSQHSPDAAVSAFAELLQAEAPALTAGRTVWHPRST